MTRDSFRIAANSEVEETVKRIMSHKGILGVVIVNNDGIPIRSTLDNIVSVQYAGLVTQLVIKSRSMIRDLQTDNDLQFLRLRSKKHEILIAPGTWPMSRLCFCKIILYQCFDF